jgi:hypothetical protein
MEGHQRGLNGAQMQTTQEVWSAHLAGRISEADAERLDAELRAPPRPSTPQPRPVGRFPRMPRQRSPDRAASIERRKTLAATWALPPTMAAKLTPCEQAYCRLLADDFATKGYTDVSHAAMAARVGCCVETIQRAQTTLRALGWVTVEHRPVPGRKHLPNVIRVVSPEWQAWIENGPRRKPDPWKVSMPRLPLSGCPLPLIGWQKSPATANPFLLLGAQIANRAETATPGVQGMPKVEVKGTRVVLAFTF